MIAANRLSWLLALAGVAALLTGCPNKPKPDGGTGDGGITCVDNTDCPDQNLFFCNNTTGLCEPSCKQKSDCSAASRGQWALPYCNGPLGCQCDQGTCVAALCSADSDCGGGTVCRNGGCVTAPAASTVTSCQVTPDVVVTAKGATAKLWVSTWDSSNNPVVLTTGITWSAAASLSVAGNGTNATVTANAATGGTPATVTVSVGTAMCTASVSVIDASAVAAGHVEVVAVDELTGRPIQGATVVANDVATGTQVGTPQMTAADGTATVTAGTAVHVSVFHTDYNYLTIANYNPAAGGATRLLSVVLRRNALDKIGGYKGTFGNLPNSPNILAGIAGMSIAGSITDLSLEQLLGSTVDTEVKIGTAIDKTLPLPVGVFLEFNQTPIKATDSAQGLAGVCTDSFAGGNAESLITAGTCGTRSAWGLAGDVAISDLPISALSGGLSNLDYGAILSQIIPIFRKFNSSVGRDIQFKLNPPPADGGYDPSQFSSFDHDFQQIPLGFSYAIKVPTLPKFGGNYVDGVIALAGTNSPGRGVVPLGLGAGVNTMPADGQIDAQTIGQVTLPAGQMFMRQAPTHHGLEGNEYGIVSLAVSLKSLTAGLAASALFTRLPGNALAFDPNGTTPVDLGAGGASFIAFPENAKFNFGNTALPALPLRTFKFSTAPDFTGVSVMRVVFTNAAGHRWTVVVDPANPTFTLPNAPNGFEDRTFSNASMNGQSGMLVQFLQLNTQPSGGGSAISFKQLVELGSSSATRLNDFTTAFSVKDYGSPSISWKTPSADGQTVGHGTTVTVTVKNFSIGTATDNDGTVQLSFTGATVPAGCTAATGATADASGNVQIQVPAACMGATGATMTATLYDNTSPAAPHQPGVSASLQNTTVN